MSFSNTPPDPISVGTAPSNTPPTSSAAGVVPSNTAPTGVSAGVVPSNTAPTSSAAGTAPSNTAPGRTQWPRFVVVSGAGEAAVNGTYEADDTSAEFPTYTGPGLCEIIPDAGSWAIYNSVLEIYTAVSLNGPWVVGDGGSNPVPTTQVSSFSNTAPGAKSAGVTPNNTAPTANSAGVTPSNTAPTPSTAGVTPSNTPPAQLVLPNEVSPVGAAVGPSSPVEVAHTEVLLNDRNYRVSVGNRVAPIVITLPDPAGLNQDIEIVDASNQAGTYPITVDGGTQNIGTDGTQFVITRDEAVLHIYYTNNHWKKH